MRGEGERTERTISQIIWKDYRGFSQITLSTEGETEIKRLEKGSHFSAVSHTIYLILIATCSLNLPLCVSPVKIKRNYSTFSGLQSAASSKEWTFLRRVDPRDKKTSVSMETSEVSEEIPMFAHSFVMNKTSRNPLQINPAEASAPIHSLKSMSRISNTGSIRLQSRPAEVFAHSVNEWNPSGVFVEPSQGNANVV